MLMAISVCLARPFVSQGKIMSLVKFTLAALLTLIGLAAIPSGWAQTYAMLYAFTGGTDGSIPEGRVTLDPSGIDRKSVV